MQATLLFLVAAALLAAGRPIAAQAEETMPKGIKFDRTTKQRMKIGLIVESVGVSYRGVFATTTVPADWPEQKVTILDQEISRSIGKVSYRTVGGTVKQMVIEIPRLPAGTEARALVTFEIEHRTILPPDDTSIFVVPTKVQRRNRVYLGSSPYIETRNRKIRRLAKEVVKDKETAWAQAESIYDWVRDNVEYKNGKLKGAVAALRDGDGDCEELTSLFVAMCRVNKIPARTVWIPGHCYPEFYLQDDDGNGHWFPCQAAGTRAFGAMPDDRPILQKGDNFRVPEKSKPQRYVAEFLRIKDVRGNGRPKFRFVRQSVPVN